MVPSPPSTTASLNLYFTPDVTLYSLVVKLVVKPFNSAARVL
jgi:hypothetical protein